MSGYCAKSDVLNVARILQSKMDDSGAKALENVISAVEDMVEADAVPVVHGHWIGKPLAGYSTVKCSACGSAFMENNGKWKYCPDCGALMMR